MGFASDCLRCVWRWFEVCRDRAVHSLERLMVSCRRAGSVPPAGSWRLL